MADASHDAEMIQALCGDIIEIHGGPFQLVCGKGYHIISREALKGAECRLSSYLLVNLNDRSGVFYPWLDWSLSDDAELNLVGYLPWGGLETEYGAFGAGGFARIRVYF